MRTTLSTVLWLAVGASAGLAAAHERFPPPHRPPPPPHRPPPPPPPGHGGAVVNHVIYEPPKGSRALYPRVAELRDGTLLVTTSVTTDSFFGGEPVFPIFASSDGGHTWEWISNLTDQVNGWGMHAQPALLELAEPLGGFEPGTILASGNSWSPNGTRIDLYASTDKARTWQFVSRVAEGGRPNTTNGETPVWEPFLVVYEHELICYYSDQRDPKHGQKLAHQRSRDLRHWGPVVDDVAEDVYEARPGMTVVAEIPPLGQWIVVYELPVGESSSHGANYPVHYRLADDPRRFLEAAEAHPVLVDGTAANASPYVVWSPVGGPNGTLVVSDADESGVYVNRAGGRPDAWEKHPTDHPPAYSRALHVFRRHPEKLAIIGGATFDEGGENSLRITVLDLRELLGIGGKPGHPK